MQRAPCDSSGSIDFPIETMGNHCGSSIETAGNHRLPIETIADEQMRTFRNIPENKGKTMRFKLWKYSRHPNYLGEVLFWYGIYFMGLSSGIMPIWTILCPLVMLFLFIFISCPMMDKRSLKNRSDYQDYMNKTSQLFLLPPK